MTTALSSGPRGLAGDSVAALAEMITDPTLRRLAQEFDPKEHGGRLVCGPTGIGKSVAGIAVLRRSTTRTQWAKLLQPKGYSWEPDYRRFDTVAWVRAFDLPSARLSHALGDGEAGLVAAAMCADFLVLDDLGWESRRASADDVITEVIATRYDAGRVTYATTGLRLAEFTERYSSAIVRRLTETGRVKGKVVNCWSREVGK